VRERRIDLRRSIQMTPRALPALAGKDDDEERGEEIEMK
jgi:hypothetical protein